MKHLAFAFLLSLSFIGFSQAADTAPAKSDPTWLIESRASIKSEKYEQAIKQLQERSGS